MNDDFKEELKDCYARIEQLEAALREIIADSFSVYAIEVARAALDYREMDVYSIGHKGGSCPRERT